LLAVQRDAGGRYPSSTLPLATLVENPMKNDVHYQEKCRYGIILSGTVIAIFLVLVDSAFSRPVVSGVRAEAYHLCQRELSILGYPSAPSFCTCVANRVTFKSKTVSVAKLEANATQVATEAAKQCGRG
jgi:hypothetical protein